MFVDENDIQNTQWTASIKIKKQIQFIFVSFFISTHDKFVLRHLFLCFNFDMIWRKFFDVVDI